MTTEDSIKIENLMEEIDVIDRSNKAPTQYQNFRGKDMSGTDFSNQDRTGCNFREANLDGCNFSGTTLHYANFKDATTNNVIFDAGTKTFLSVWLVDAPAKSKNHRASNMVLVTDNITLPNGKAEIDKKEKEIRDIVHKG